MNQIRAIDLFCGAGGSSWGARLAGVDIIAGFDASAVAKQAFTANFPTAAFFHDLIENLDPVALKRRIGRIDLILASPECTSHSPAKGAAMRCDRSRNTAFEVVRFAEAFSPRWIVVENVVSMRKWSSYGRFKVALEALGYNIEEEVLNAASFGVPQRRRRLFLLCDNEAPLRKVRASRGAYKPARTAIDMNGTYPLSELRSSRRAPATVDRAERAIAALGNRRPFLIVYYSSDKAGGWQRVSETLRTITTVDRFALVKPRKHGHVMRMLQVPELRRAMGMPARFSLGRGTRREQIHLIGNAVCPAVMRAIVRSLLRN